MSQAGPASPRRQPTVYVLLPVHNRRDITVAFAKQLRNQTYRNYRLLLIDDGSTDGTAEAVTEVIHDVVVIRGNGTWWWAGSLQQGYKWLRRNETPADDVVLIMNDDTVFEHDFLSIGLRVLGDNPGAMVTATGYNVATGKPQDSGVYVFSWPSLRCAETYKTAEINCSSTRGLMSSVSDFIEVGGFRPRLIPHYLSDIEFTMRAHKLGKKLTYHPDFRIGIHFELTGHREVGDVPLREYLRKVFSRRSAMNPIYWSNFVLLHSPWRYKLVNLRNIWDAVYERTVRTRVRPRLRALKRKLTRGGKRDDGAV